MKKALCLLPLALLSSCLPLSTDPLKSVREQTKGNLGYDLASTTTGGNSSELKSRVNAILGRPLSVNGAVQIALLNNRRLRATLEEVGISQAELVEASTPRNPTLASSLRFPSGGGSANWELNIAGDVLDSLLIPLNQRIAANELVATERRVSHEILQLSAETKGTWFTLLASEQELRKLKDIAGVSETMSDFATRVHDAGNINDLELMELQVGYQQAQADIKRAGAEVETHRAKLNRLLGLSGSQTGWSLALNELPGLPSADPSLAKAEATALAQRQDLAAAKARLAAMETALAVKKKTRLIPGLNLGGDTEHDSGGGQVSAPTLDIELPLFNRGKASVAKLEAGLRQANDEVEAIESEIRNDVAASHTAMRLARDAAEYQTSTLLPQRQRILKETLLHYNAMQKSNIALLRAKDDEQRAEKEAIDCLRDYWLARGELEKAVGGNLNARAKAKSAPARTMAPAASTATVSGGHPHKK
jgi:cobalt-zinc-cadmium efflux system outer membrane protein